MEKLQTILAANIAIRRATMLDKLNTEDKVEKREKFVKLAENRTVNAIKAIRVIGKLGNKNAYQFDDSDVKKIVRALTKEVDALQARMSSSGGKESVDFKLEA
jgi:ribosomal protein L7/L12